jgi:hypothetical protein
MLISFNEKVEYGPQVKMVCPESENNGRNQAKLNFENDQSL